MKQYLDLLERVLNEGVKRSSNETSNDDGIVVFGHSMKLDIDLPMISIRGDVYSLHLQPREITVEMANEVCTIDHLFTTIFYWRYCSKRGRGGIFQSLCNKHRKKELSENFITKYSPQTPNGSLHQRRNRRERLQLAFLRKGGEIRQRYEAHSELYRDRHRRLTQEISIGQKTAGDISLAGESQRALSFLSNLNPEA